MNCCCLFGLCQLVEWTNVEQQADEIADAAEARRCLVLGEISGVEILPMIDHEMRQ